MKISSFRRAFSRADASLIVLRSILLKALPVALCASLVSAPAGASHASSKLMRVIVSPTTSGAASGDVVSGDEAERLLDEGRRGLLNELKSRSRQPVQITVDPQSRAVLTLSLDYPAAAPSSRDPGGQARLFLKNFQRLIDPRVNPDEYVVLSENRGCDDSVMVFSRVINGQTVLGSKLTVHRSRDGNVVGVVNGVASTVSRVLPAVVTEESRRRLERMQPKGMNKSLCRRYKVLAPDLGGETPQLREANVVVWNERGEGAGNKFMAALEGLGDGVVGPFAVNDLSGAGGVAPSPREAQPKYRAGARTGLPDSISYHSIGGVTVEQMPADRNPAETVYRFLEQHPALFRTGAPRCQYGVKSISESPLAPKVQFVRMAQRYAGLPVFASELVFEIYDKNKVLSVSGHVLPFINVNPNPRLTPAEAVTSAKRSLLAALSRVIEPDTGSPITGVIDAARPTPELVVFPGELVPQRQLSTALAYKVVLDEFVYFVNAETGEELYSFPTRARQQVNDGLSRSPFARLSYARLANGGMAIPGATTDPAVLAELNSVLASISAVGGFYGSLSWHGIRRGGGDFVANINVNIDPFLGGCPNAFFDLQITGEAFFCIGVGLPDVVGHEFTHGIISNSSDLIYLDESGALNESYADLFGNLIFPDAAAPGASPGWLVSEPSTVRDMRTPGNFMSNLGIPDPGTMGGYISRNTPGSGCDLLSSSCDAGFVHSNSGIVNRAHVLLSDGVAGTTPGIGRAKLKRLAFLVMTERLTPWSRLIDAALATRDMANTLVISDAATMRTGADTFVQADADQVPIAFGMAGLSPDLITGWSEPSIGFSGTETFFAGGETTANGCPVSNVTASLASPSGLLGASLTPAAGVSTSVDFLGLYGISFDVPPGTPPPPVGTTNKIHTVSWFNIFGQRPSFTTQVIADPVPPAVNCLTPPGSVPVERTSAIISHGGGLFGASGLEAIPASPSSMNAACSLRLTQVELLDDADGVIKGPENSARSPVVIFRLFGFPVTVSRGARIVTSPPTGTAPPPRNLSAQVNWFSEAFTGVRYRLRYYIDQPAGVVCVP